MVYNDIGINRNYNSLYDPDNQDVYIESRGQKVKEDPYLQDLLVGTTIYDKHRL